MPRNQTLSMFRECVEKLQKDDLPPREVIRQLAVLHREAGFGEEIQPCIAAGGLEALVRVAVTGWPADGNLDTSSHPYDAVVDCGDGPCTLPGIEPEPGEEQ